MLYIGTSELSAYIFRSRGDGRFNRLVQKARWLDRWRRLTGKRRNLVKYDDVVGLCGGHINRLPKVAQVPIRQIVGSVGRAKDFTCDMLPRPCVDSRRWMSIEQAIESGVELPPIELYRIADVYFIVDGHHRTSVAHANTSPTIDAVVIARECHKRLTVEDFRDEDWIEKIVSEEVTVEGGENVYPT